MKRQPTTLYHEEKKVSTSAKNAARKKPSLMPGSWNKTKGKKFGW